MPTVLIDARPMMDPHAGGVPRVARGLVPAIMAAMPDARFVLGTTGWNNRADAQDEWAPRWPSGRPYRIPNKLWSLATVARVTSFDHAFAKHKPDLLLLPNIGFIGTPRIPYALVVHDLSFLIEPQWFSLRARLWHKAVRAVELIRNARWLFAVSETTKRDLVRLLGIDPDRITVIKMGMETAKRIHGDAQPPFADDRPYFLALNVRDRRKNAACAIEAFRLLSQEDRYRHATLVVAGCRLDHVRAHGRAPIFCSRVVVLGRPSDAALQSLYEHAAALLYPSWYEGYGLPLHEAARYGTPCIASTAGALPETAPSGTLFAPPAKPQLWTEIMAAILDHPDVYRTRTNIGGWGEAGRMVAARMRENAPTTSIFL